MLRLIEQTAPMPENTTVRRVVDMTLRHLGDDDWNGAVELMASVLPSGVVRLVRTALADIAGATSEARRRLAAPDA